MLQPPAPHECMQRGPTRLRRPNPTRIRTTPRNETRQPAAGGGGQTLPLLKVVGVAHGCVSPTADGNPIGKGERAAFALGDVVSDVEIKNADAIGAPADRALVCKGVSKSFAPQCSRRALGMVAFRTVATPFGLLAAPRRATLII